MNIGKVALLLCFLYATTIAQLTDTEILEVYKDADKWKELVNKATITKHQHFQPLEDGKTCSACRTAAGTLITVRRLGGSKGIVAWVARGICLASLLTTRRVCDGMIEQNIDIFLHIVDNNTQLTPYTVCGIMLQVNNCALGSDANNHLEWSVHIDEEFRRSSNGSKSEITKASKDDLVIVHITDIHYDPYYREGANAVCGEPVCCRENQGKAKLPENGAGRWGDYRDCDPPWEAVLSALKSIRANHKKIDYIYYTGDVVDHGAWEANVTQDTISITKTFDAMRSIFKYVPIYPIIGNHEPHPAFQFAPSQHKQSDTTELFQLLAKTWHWLPKHARDKIRNSGYYTVLIQKGLRVIAMNNNEGYSYNLWLMYDSSYFAKQLQWLHDTLLNAERDGEKVHILAHIPNASSDLFSTYSREYRRIVDRFWNTISAQFNGHTHFDQFTIFYAIDEPKSAINVAWNGGSVTPFSNFNPNYRVYSVDKNTFQVTDHETLIYNLTEANLNRNSRPVWYQEYTFSNAYEISTLSPAALDVMLTSFATNHDLLRLYWQHSVKMGDPSLKNGCDNKCLLSNICGITQQLSTIGAKDARCDELTELFWKNI